MGPVCGFAQTAATQAHVSWLPQPPTQGSLILISVSPLWTAGASDSATRVTGHLAGQPLHFEAKADGAFTALGGIPVHADGSIPLTFAVQYQDSTTKHRLVRIPISAGEFASERLSVDPRYAEEPDSTLAARIEAEAASARAVSRRSHRIPRFWRGGFLRPTDGRVTSEFGKGREFNAELTSRHMGVDLAGARGTAVLAANRGIVALVGDFYYAGRVIYVDHGRGLVTAYLHLSDVTVAVGERVERGHVIGRVGATGRVTGPHLHWIVRYGTVTVDPLSLLQLDLSGFR